MAVSIVCRFWRITVMGLSLAPCCSLWIVLLLYLVQGFSGNGYKMDVILMFLGCSLSLSFSSIWEFHCMIQVTHPLCDRNMISARLDAVSEISESMGSSRASQNIGGLDGEDSDITIVQPEFSYILSSVLTNLGRSPDIQRGITRIFHRTATPSEVINHSSFGPLLCIDIYI